jgi:hypothetical protein
MDIQDRAELDNYFSSLSGKTFAEWASLPDFGLYMDQVVTYLERQLEIFMRLDDSGKITPSMINNYAKAKIVPRTEGKKYGQEHIALLLAVFTLKRVLSVQDMRALFGRVDDIGEMKGFYERFRAGLERSARETAAGVGSALADAAVTADAKVLRNLALELAVDASMRSFAAEMLLAYANPGKGDSEKDDATRKKKQKEGQKESKKAVRAKAGTKKNTKESAEAARPIAGAKD